jgi:hypothetical protein
VNLRAPTDADLSEVLALMHAQRHGYRVVRHHWRMVIDLDEEPDVVFPSGIEIRSYRPGEEREIHAALEEAWSVGADAESPTGATRLYERAGMRVLYEVIVYEKELRAA